MILKQNFDRKVYKNRQMVVSKAAADGASHWETQKLPKILAQQNTVLYPFHDYGFAVLAKL